MYRGRNGVGENKIVRGKRGGRNGSMRPSSLLARTCAERETFACDLNVVSRARFQTKSALSVCVNDCLIKYRLSSKGAALICDQML